METKQNLPEVQYALFCREVIESSEEWEFTLKDVIHAITADHPQDIFITLVLRILNVDKGLHNIDVNCMVLPDQLLKYNFDLDVRKRGNCLFTRELIVPIQQTSEYIFTILYDGNPIKRLRLPIRVLAQK